MKGAVAEWPSTVEVEASPAQGHAYTRVYWRGAHLAHDVSTHNWAMLDQSDFIATAYTTLDVKMGELAWQLREHFKAAFGYTERVQELCQRLEKIEHVLSQLVERLDRNANPRQSVLVPVQSFASEPYEVVRPFSVVVSPADDGYEAGFFEANLFASGDTEEEAVRNLKSVLVETYQELGRLGDSNLGPEPLRQKQVLAGLIRKLES